MAALDALDYFLVFAFQQAWHFQRSDTRETAYAALIGEQANLNFIVNWGFRSETSPDAICKSGRLVAALATFWAEAKVEPHEIQQKFRGARAAAVRIGDDLCLAHLRLSQADVMASTDDIRAALDEYAEAANMYAAVGADLGAAIAHIGQGTMLAKMDAPDEAEDKLATGLRALPDTILAQRNGAGIAGRTDDGTIDTIILDALLRYNSGLQQFDACVRRTFGVKHPVPRRRLRRDRATPRG